MGIHDLPALLVGGLSSGALYGLIAVSVVLVFRTTGLVNFAQGELLTVGAYTYLLSSRNHAAPIIQIALVAAVGLVTGIVFFVVTNDVLGRADDVLTIVIGTLGLSLIIVNIADIKYGDFPYPTTGFLTGSATVRVGNAAVTANSVVLIGYGFLATAALYLMFRFTHIGRAMRAVAESRSFAALSGIPVRRMLVISWALAAVLAAIGGLLYAPGTGVYPAMGADIVFKGFVAATIGGFESETGAMLGGLMLGLIEVIGTVYVGGVWNEVLAFGVLLAILAWRPTGLFGRTGVRRA